MQEDIKEAAALGCAAAVVLSCPLLSCPAAAATSSLVIFGVRADTDGPGYVPGTVNGFGPLSRHVCYEI